MSLARIVGNRYPYFYFVLRQYFIAKLCRSMENATQHLNKKSCMLYVCLVAPRCLGVGICSKSSCVSSGCQSPSLSVDKLIRRWISFAPLTPIVTPNNMSLFWLLCVLLNRRGSVIRSLPSNGYLRDVPRRRQPRPTQRWPPWSATVRPSLPPLISSLIYQNCDE